MVFCFFLVLFIVQDAAEEARTSRKKSSGRREDSKSTMAIPSKEHLNLSDRGDLTPVAEEVPTPEKSLSRKSSVSGKQPR